MTDREKIKELEKRLEIYESDPAAGFYKELVTAIGHIKSELQNKTLDFKNDKFAASIAELMEKSGKMFDGLKMARESLNKAKPGDIDKEKNVGKAIGRVGV